MNEDYVDPDDLELFTLPENMLSHLFEFSGSTGGVSGFILTYVNQKGTPSIITKANSPIVEMGLRQALTQYLDQVAAQELGKSFPQDFGDEETP